MQFPLERGSLGDQSAGSLGQQWPIEITRVGDGQHRVAQRQRLERIERVIFPETTSIGTGLENPALVSARSTVNGGKASPGTLCPASQ
ncbi:MAG: hypothetical protein ABSE57_31155 [Bryobacteraceae bacterium]